jgi:N-methylhydantoinase A
MIESGPAAGAIAASWFAREALPSADAVAFDMGGTTAKMSLIQGGVPAVTREYEVAHVHRFKPGSGLPLQISAIELLEIGAGGGSIARVNELGLLNVGPHSAGAEPGPACYGLGGVEPTVTDADLLLGYLDPAHFLGGEMALDASASLLAVKEKVADRLSMEADSVAWGIHDLVNESMAAAVRAHAAEKGVDLRRFSLIAFGGAGPIHAYGIARKLGISRILCPFGAGVASAIGCLVAVPGVDVVAAEAGLLAAAEWRAIGCRFAEMEKDARSQIEALVGPGAETRLHPAIEMRCEGQGYSVVVELQPGTPIDAGVRPELERRFVAAYEQLYGHKPPSGVPLETVNLRARVEHPRTVTGLRRAGTGRSSALVKGVRRACFESARGFVETRVFDRYALRPGEWHSGPAVVEERETTTIVGPDARFRADDAGHLLIEIEGGSTAR